MTDPAAVPDGSDLFEAFSSPETAVSQPAFEGTNVSRVAGLSTMLGGDVGAVRQLASELGSLGFAEGLTSGERVLRAADPLDTFPSLDDQQGPDNVPNRAQLWQMINEGARPTDANAFIIAVLGSELERESAAAAAALWRQIDGFDLRPFQHRRPFHLMEVFYEWPEEDWLHPDSWSFPFSPFGPVDIDTALGAPPNVPWDSGRWAATHRRAMSIPARDRYFGIFVVNLLTRQRLRLALRSQDAVTRSLAMAAFLPPPSQATVPTPPSTTPSTTRAHVPPVSTMVHGTWGWKGDWWRPGGDFHHFVQKNHQQLNLYCGGARFSWDGAYRDDHRVRAAIDLQDWADDRAPDGLHTVFAHSYGGDIAARAIVTGLNLKRLVLLSVPVTGYVKSVAKSGVPIVDVRLRFDPVLALARVRQRVPARANVATILLNRWRYDHGASHKADVWLDENLDQRSGF